MSSDFLKNFLNGYSIEVTPRAVAKIEDLSEFIPSGTLVYIAHIEGTPIEEMVKTAKKINDQGYETMPHFPARIIKNKNTLKEWIFKYQNEANVHNALLLGGGVTKPYGEYDSSIQLIESELFDLAGFKKLYIAGPAKLQTLLKYSLECGVGASIKILQKRAMNLTKLLLPYKPIPILTELAAYKSDHPDFNIEKVHFFPLGGVKQATNFVKEL